MGEGTEAEETNMAAWLVAKNTLRIMPFKLPPLGLWIVLSFFFYWIGRYNLLCRLSCQ
jgi:hypothetical protein